MTMLTFADLRDAVRGLRRAPVVSIAAILCLALGIGVTTAVSSAVDRALLQPLPYKDPGRLATVGRTTPFFKNGPFSVPNYRDFARATHSLSDLAAVSPGSQLLVQSDQSTQVVVGRVTGNLLPMLGVPAQLGRLISPDDDQLSAHNTAMLSDEFWHAHFGGDRSVVGKTVDLGGDPTTVIGVMPPNFRVVQGLSIFAPEVWIPMRFTAEQEAQRRTNFILLMGRLAPGSTVAAADQEFQSIFSGILAAHPELNGEGVQVQALNAQAAAGVRKPLLLLFGAVCMVLLIAATNVAGLLLARGVQRRRELAIRAALGGSRWHIVRPILAESVVLTSLGLLAGIGLAFAGVRTIGAVAVQRLPQLAGLHVDGRVIAFAVVLSLLVSVGAAALPAWRGASVDPQDALRGGRGGGAGREQHRTLGMLVTAEVGLSLVLLISSALVLKGFMALLDHDPGFETASVLTFDVAVPPEQYPNGTSTERFLQPLEAKLRALPGVASAGTISLIPYVNWGNNFNIRYEGQPKVDPAKLPLAEYRVVDRGYYDVTKLRLLDGRLFTESDLDPKAPTVVVVNEALAKRDFKDRSPVGQRFYTGDTSFATIVGVVADVRNVGPIREPAAETDWPYQHGGGDSRYAMMVRVSRGDPAAIESAVRGAVKAVEPQAAVTRMRPMDDVIAASVGQPRFYLMLIGVFASVAVLLAVAGLYGVMSYAVAQRTREIGIRNALGSPAGSIVALVTRQGMTVVTFGVVAGLAGAVATTRLLQQMLYGVSPYDPPMWTSATAALVAAGLLASVLPALRAARVDPLIAMRME